MNRLIAFGCSSTYGQGLPDCPTGIDQPPSRFAWPNLLSKELNLEEVNTSMWGVPNKSILLKILNFPFQKDDLAIVLWSFQHRGYIFENDGTPKSIMHTNTDCEYQKDFFMVHSEYDLVNDSILFMHHAGEYLKNKKITHLQFYFDTTIKDYIDLGKNVVPVSAIYLGLYTYPNGDPINGLRVDTATDNIHVGVKTQENVAKDMLKRLKEFGCV